MGASGRGTYTDCAHVACHSTTVRVHCIVHPMARMELDVVHTLTLEDAIERIRALGEFYHHRHGAQVSWTHHTCTLEARYVGIRLSANARVEPTRVHVDCSDPGFLLRKRGAEYLRKKLERFLDPNNALESLPRR